MYEELPTALTVQFDDVTVGETLHDVPPHRVFEVSVDGTRAVCKRSVESRATAGIEGRVMRYVGHETSVPVPELLAIGEDWYLAAWCADAPAEPPDDEKRLERSWLRTAGRTLATLHADATFDRPGLLAIDGNPTDSSTEIRVDAPPDGSWSEALDDLLAVYESSLRETRYRNSIATARTFLTDFADRFDVLGDREPALLHGWFTPEHVAVSDGEPTCVLDFEHALVGSPEWDYWRTAVPLFVGPAWEKPPDAEDIFRRAYESVRPLPAGFDDRADAYRAFVAASHLDSLATQRGIDEQTRELADFLAEYIVETLADCQERWK